MGILEVYGGGSISLSSTKYSEPKARRQRKIVIHKFEIIEIKDRDRLFLSFCRLGWLGVY